MPTDNARKFRKDFSDFLNRRNGITEGGLNEGRFYPFFLGKTRQQGSGVERENNFFCGWRESKAMIVVARAFG